MEETSEYIYYYSDPSYKATPTKVHPLLSAQISDDPHKATPTKGHP